MKKLCIVVSSPMTIKAFLMKHIFFLSKKYQVYVVSNSDIDFKKEYGIECVSKKIEIERDINPFSDFKSIIKLYNYLKNENMDITLSVSPKAGLVSSIASFFARVKIRVHFFTGQVWVTKRGLFRIVLKNIDRLIATLNTHNLIDSPSQRDFLIKENVVSKQKSKVLLQGSISGVDRAKFRFNKELQEELKTKYSIGKEDLVFMFIGRLNTDKGIYDLVEVFDILLKRYNNIKLFLIGPDEEGIENNIKEFLAKDGIIRLDYVSNPEYILNIADVLVLPSYREGFGTIVIEAASMGVPSIASNIYGLKDAVEDKKTGLLHSVGDRADMREKYEFFINNSQLFKEYGLNAQQRVELCFKDELLSQSLVQYIEEVINAQKTI